MIARCIYASRAAAGTDERILSGILDQSRDNNARMGVTGLLVHTEGMFVQVLEGGRPELSGLIAKLMRDERHTDVTLLSFEEISARRYENWTMGRVDMNAINTALVLKYATHARFNPFAMSGSAAAVLLSDIAASGAVMQR
jgi:hypothetical protein